MHIPPPGMVMGQLAKTWGLKEKWMDSNSLAMIDNYHLPRENATFRFVIWHGHFWGGRFQMAGVGYRQFKARLAHLHHLTAGDFAVILRKRQMLEKRRSAELLLTWLPLG